MPGDILVQAEGVGKKFCRSLKRSMFYAGVDIGRAVLRRPPPQNVLRTDEFWALDDVSFELRQGECLGLIGPNGSGKSTLLRVLNGIIPPDKGRITLHGAVGGLIQVGAGFHAKLTGRENIYITGAVRGMSRREIDSKMDEIVAFSGIEEFLDMPVQFYSSGMTVRLGYSVAAHMSPDILLLDEVLAVGDVAFRYKCLSHIRQKIENGVTPIFVTHSMEQLAFICSRVIVFSHGRQVFDGGVDEGIAMYQEVLSEDGRKGHRDPGRIVFDPRAAVVFARLVSHPDGWVSTGDDLVFRFGVQALEPLPELGIVVRVESPVAGNIAALDSASAGFAIDGSPGQRVLEVRIPALPLLPGSYTLKLVLQERKSLHTFMRWIGAVKFRVGDRGDRNARYLLTLRDTWHELDAADSARETWPEREAETPAEAPEGEA
jgi:lipopolysaccharide transport system ATP-binding protein